MLYWVIIVCFSLCSQRPQLFSSITKTTFCFTFLRLSKFPHFLWVSWTAPEGHNMQFLRNFLRGKTKICVNQSRRSSKSKPLLEGWKDWIVNSQPRDKLTVPCILAGKAWQNHRVLSLFFHLWLAHSCSFFDRKWCTSSRHCPPIVNIIKWFMFSNFVKETTWSREGCGSRVKSHYHSS